MFGLFCLFALAVCMCFLAGVFLALVSLGVSVSVVAVRLLSLVLSSAVGYGAVLTPERCGVGAAILQSVEGSDSCPG
jgi:hypothetical protein